MNFLAPKTRVFPVAPRYKIAFFSKMPVTFLIKLQHFMETISLNETA
jgi:hypothetical protein